MEPDPPPVELTVLAESSRYDPDDDQWLAQSADLYEALYREVDGFKRVPAPGPAGTKGALDTVIIALGSAGAFTALVDCFRAWLARDKQRRLVVTVKQGEQSEQVVIEGDGLDAASFAQLTEAVGARMKDTRWPLGTEPS
jgi:hypothetical protein